MQQESIPHLCNQFYTVHRQWHAHKTYAENLNKSSTITVDDYQMNIEIEYVEASTSSASSANKKNICIVSHHNRISGER